MAGIVDFNIHTDLIASCRHPQKGHLLFARQKIPVHSTIAVCQMRDIVKDYFNTWQHFKLALDSHKEDAVEFLMHCCPVGDGRICEQDTRHFNAFFNHSGTPNCSQICERFTASHMLLVALKEIDVGDELTVDYDRSVGYEKYGHEEHVKQFLQLCDQHGVHKRPSMLTMGPVRIELPSTTATCPSMTGSIIFFYSDKFEESRHFYEHDLGLEVRRDLGNVVFYCLPGNASTLGVVRQGISASKIPPCSPAQAGKDTAMLCLLSENVSDWHSRLAQRGVEFEQPPQKTEKFGIFNTLLRDPDGYLVEIQHFLCGEEQQRFCGKRKAAAVFLD